MAQLEEALDTLLAAEAQLLAALEPDGVLGANWEQVCGRRRGSRVCGSNKETVDIDGEGRNQGYYAALGDIGGDMCMNGCMEECMGNDGIKKGSLCAQPRRALQLDLGTMGREERRHLRPRR